MEREAIGRHQATTEVALRGQGRGGEYLPSKRWGGGIRLGGPWGWAEIAAARILQAVSSATRVLLLKRGSGAGHASACH
jgi:hypothetical protein